MLREGVEINTDGGQTLAGHLTADKGATFRGDEQYGFFIKGIELKAEKGAKITGAELKAEQGATISGSLLNAQNGATISGPLTANNGATISGSLLNAQNGATISGPLTANNGATISGPLTANNGATITGAEFKAEKGANITGISTVTGNETISGTQTVGGLLTSGSEKVNGTSTVTGLLTANGGITVPNEKNVYIGGTDSEQVIGLQLRGQTRLHFGADLKQDAVESTISYKKWDSNALCIVGSHGSGVRKVHLWDDVQVDRHLYVNKMVQCETLNITSDKRIKKNIQELSPQESLEIIRNINPVKYQFKDTGKEICGFLAQDIQQLLPISVASRQQLIHNIYETCHAKNDILTFSTFKTSELAKGTSELAKGKIKVGEDLVTILEILDDSSIRIDKDLDGEVFVYGQEVDDFLSIDQNQIFTVATSAVQELDKQLQLTNSALILATRQLQEEKQTTQIELAKLKRQLQEEKQQSKNVLDRLIRLEKNLIL